MSTRAAAVVVGLDCITGLQTARILRGHGVPVIGLVNDDKSFAARTRSCTQVRRCDLLGEGFIEELERLGPQLPSKAVLFPCTDLSVQLISVHRERLAPWYHVLLPKHEAVQLLLDKASFLQHALDHGLAVPRTVLVRTRGDAQRAAQTLTFPCVLKPPVKTPLWQASTAAKVIRVGTAAELLEAYDHVRGWADLLVAQEWVVGGEDALYSCNAYFDRSSTPLVTFVARKLRQWPVDTGTSCLGEECRNDEVQAETVRLFGSVNFHGLAYLEMKRDQRTGRHYIIEPNVGRPTGRSAIAEAGGVDLLYAAYCDATGEPLPAGLVQRFTGVKWIDDRRDLQASLQHLWMGELTLRQWRTSVAGRKAHAVWSVSDPLPFVLDLAQTARKGLSRLARRVRRP